MVFNLTNGAKFKVGQLELFLTASWLDRILCDGFQFTYIPEGEVLTMYKSGYYPSSDARKCLFTYRQRGLLPTKVSGSLLCRPVGILSNKVGGGRGQITDKNRGNGSVVCQWGTNPPCLPYVTTGLLCMYKKSLALFNQARMAVGRTIN